MLVESWRKGPESHQGRAVCLVSSLSFGSLMSSRRSMPASGRRVPAAEVSCLAARRGRQLCGGEIARAGVAGRPFAALRRESPGVSTAECPVGRGPPLNSRTRAVSGHSSIDGIAAPTAGLKVLQTLPPKRDDAWPRPDQSRRRRSASQADRMCAVHDDELPNPAQRCHSTGQFVSPQAGAGARVHRKWCGGQLRMLVLLAA